MNQLLLLTNLSQNKLIKKILIVKVRPNQGADRKIWLYWDDRQYSRFSRTYDDKQALYKREYMQYADTVTPFLRKL